MQSSKKIKKGQVQGTDLSYTPSPTNGTVTSDTGTDATIPLADGTNAGLLSPAEKTKLTGIAENANNYVHPNHSGDVTSVGDGVQTIANQAVTNAKFRDSTAHTVVGRAGSGNGSVADIGLSNNTILGREGSGNVEGLSVAQVQSMIGFDAKQTIEPLPITITSNINTSSDWNGRTLILNNDSSTRTITILGGLNCEGFKTNNGTITFVAGAGRTLFQVNADSILDGLAGSNFTIVSIGLTDYLSINNV